MSDLISAASLSELPEMLAELGVDVDAFFRRVGIDRRVVGAHDRYVPFSALAAALGEAARECGMPDFALRLAGRQHPDILGPVAIAARNADTVGAALRAVTDYAHVYSPALATQLDIDGQYVAYEFRTLLRRLPARDHVVELALGVTLSAFRMLAGPEFHPTRVTFAHPQIAERAVYVGHFGCPVEFDASRSSMVFPRALMERRLREGDPLAHDLALRFMAGADRETAFIDATADMIKRSMPVGRADVPQIAELLMVHPRSLQRRLRAAGTSFEEVFDQVRRDTADGLLANPDVPMSTVSRHLGYSEQSSLTRSSRRWFGVTPGQRRRALLQSRPED
ncbi:AraC family transcriptional regulator [Gordonia alkaliphila]|uniref:AraC family transcriptional regulator n=1 Tax=Gordonia alkaliphila TaxID=1053547 RepID=UPI001FF3AC95|nr:AraC family transcriptional regulator [Gordonia alkaliphila]MCK0439428.1 AraC family transcriptional regulator [Gordonia alkaliphila]